MALSPTTSRGSSGGTTWLAGAGAPGAGIGTTGDWYENQSNRDAYNKILGATVANWASQGSVYSATSGTSHNVPLPASIAAGDLLLLAVNGLNITFGSPAPTFATPANWTRQVNRGLFGFGPNLECAYFFYIVATGNEGATVTITCDVSSFVAANVSKIQGANTTTPINAAANGTIVAGTTPATAPVTSTVVNCLIVSYLMADSSVSTATVPSGATKRFESQDASASWDNYVAFADQPQATPNTVTPNAWTLASTNSLLNYGLTLAIAPTLGTAGWVRVGAFAA